MSNKRKEAPDSGIVQKAKKARLGEGHIGENEKKLIVVLEACTLETVAMKKGYELLNCDDHQRIMKKANRDFSLARPDITHQVYMRTNKNVLIEINPQTRIPRTYKRFAGLMVKLLNEMKISAVESEGGQTLMKVIKNPVTQYFPIGVKKISTSSKGTVKELDSYVAALPNDQPTVFVIGGFSKGEVEVDYADELISFCNYPLSAALACAKLTSAFEKKWGVI